MRLNTALRVCFKDSYFWACIVYLAYAMGILSIDYCSYIYPDDPDGMPDPRCSYADWGRINTQFVFWNAVHFLNAIQFLFSWNQYGYSIFDLRLTFPEYLNMAEALLYIVSSTFYNEASTVEDYHSPLLIRIHVIEMAGATCELIAAFGWTYTWWVNYVRVPGRGWTCDDPDLWANFLIVIPSIVYVVYNIQMLLNPETYAENTLYRSGDLLYFLGAVCYLLASMRDRGWFYFMPLAGGWSYVVVEVDEGSTNQPNDYRLV